MFVINIDRRSPTLSDTLSSSLSHSHTHTPIYIYSLAHTHTPLSPLIYRFLSFLNLSVSFSFLFYCSVLKLDSLVNRPAANKTSSVEDYSFAGMMAASKQAVTAIARQSLSARELFVGTMNTICRIVNMEVVSYQVADQLTQTILAICNKTMIASTATLPPPRLMVYLFLLLIIIVNYGVWGKWGVNFSLVYLNMYAIFTFFLGIPLAQQILFQCYASSILRGRAKF